MPMPPLLLADRVLGIDAAAGAVGQKGTIWTETDIGPDAWYLHNGRVPVGVLIEAGQADLLLVSYLGADFVNKSERVYRLLGCEVTFRAELPQVGDTLHYEIQLDGYAQHGPVRIFFFHYDCFMRRPADLLRARGAGRLLHRRRTGEIERRDLGCAHGRDRQHPAPRPAGGAQ